MSPETVFGSGARMNAYPVGESYQTVRFRDPHAISHCSNIRPQGTTFPGIHQHCGRVIKYTHPGADELTNCTFVGVSKDIWQEFNV